LPKINLKKASINDLFSVWMFFLKNPETIPDEFIREVPEVHEALEELKVMSMNDEFRAAYNAHLKAQNDRRSREANAEARGELKGKREMARNALSMNLPIDQISQLTGLSLEEIESLKDKQ
jgi:predicted transposase/invertase (TIGR01784 family)